MTVAQIVHRFTTDENFAHMLANTTPENWPFQLDADDQNALITVLQSNWQTLCDDTREKLSAATWG